MCFRLFKKAGEPVEHPVIGDREGFHAELAGPLAEPVGPAATVQQTVVRMDMEVDELSYLSQASTPDWDCPKWMQVELGVAAIFGRIKSAHDDPMGSDSRKHLAKHLSAQSVDHRQITPGAPRARCTCTGNRRPQPDCQAPV